MQIIIMQFGILSIDVVIPLKDDEFGVGKDRSAGFYLFNQVHN